MYAHRQKHIERLRLVDECASFGGHVDEHALLHLPDSLEDVARLRGDHLEALQGEAGAQPTQSEWTAYVLNTRKAAHNAVFYSYSACFVNTLILNTRVYVTHRGKRAEYVI